MRLSGDTVVHGSSAAAGEPPANMCYTTSIACRFSLHPRPLGENLQPEFLKINGRCGETANFKTEQQGKHHVTRT